MMMKMMMMTMHIQHLFFAAVWSEIPDKQLLSQQAFNNKILQNRAG